MTKENLTTDEVVRDALLRAALDFTANDKGKKRDEAVFTYLCGATMALSATGQLTTECPPWLWVIGIRGGNRVEEIERLLTA